MVLLLACLIAADGAEKKGAEKKKPGDAEMIQGKWTVVESYRKGKKDDDSLGDVLTFSGKKLTVAQADSDGDFEATFILRPNKKPRHLDMIMKRGDEEATRKAIYELSGDTLKICARGPDKPRPEALGTAADDQRRMLVLKRVKADKKDDEK
jgi:uncharacterized protein (TIGR03067 family)